MNHGRDYQATLVADIAMAQEGSPCPACGNPLVLESGVALTEMWQAGDRLAQHWMRLTSMGQVAHTHWRWAGIASMWIG